MQKTCIPAPTPVRSDVEITALYYPGTDQMAEWDMMVQTRAAHYTRFRLKMLCTPHPAYPSQGNEVVKLYWGSKKFPVFTPKLIVQQESTSTVSFMADNTWHEYTVELAANPRAGKGRLTNSDSIPAVSLRAV